jgi:hypothetical protein
MNASAGLRSAPTFCMRMRRSRSTILPALLLMFAACATRSAPPPPTLPAWSEVPASVLDAFCIRLHDEGISRETALNVVATTQPLVTVGSMTALADAAFYHGRLEPSRAAESAAEGSQSLPVRTGGGTCSWRSIPAAGRRIQTDIMTVELSSPFVNPFVRGSAGLLARLSLGGESATWYWIPIARRDDTWAAGTPLPLAMRD